MSKQETEMEENNFLKLSKINVNDHVEKKAGLSYLSWPFAVAELMKADPNANWQFHEPMMFGESMMVSCTVTAFCKSMTMHLPVMDHRNQAIKNPDSFQVNKNMMRCLVKAIACHGLGLYIYAGEDLPEQEEVKLDRAKIEEFLTKIKSAKSPDVLKKVYTEAYTYAKADKSAADEVIAAKDKRKSELAIEMQGQA